MTAAVFTTQSVTVVLEKIRDQIKAATPQPADFALGPHGTRTVFDLDQVASVRWNRHTGDNPLSLSNIAWLAGRLQTLRGAVGRIAFGKYLAPAYRVHPGQFITPVGTRSGVPEVRGVNEVYFNLYLPSGLRPVRGWPVVIFGHGGNNSKDLDSVALAMLANRGVATIAINAVGRGFGQRGTLTVELPAGRSVTFPSGGRGFDQNGDGAIRDNEGAAAREPQAIIGPRDAKQQTVADLMQLVRVTETGMHADGDGAWELDSSRIYFLGWSFGGGLGVQFLAVEPSVRAGVLNVPAVAGGSLDQRLRPDARQNAGIALRSRLPSLIEPPGVKRVDGVVVLPPYFNENFPLRNDVPLGVELEDGTSHEIQSPVINTVTRAMQIQEALDSIHDDVSEVGRDAI